MLIKSRTMRSAQNVAHVVFLSDNKISVQEAEGKGPSIRTGIIQNMTPYTYRVKSLDWLQEYPPIIQSRCIVSVKKNSKHFVPEIQVVRFKGDISGTLYWIQFNPFTHSVHKYVKRQHGFRIENSYPKT